LRGYDKISLIEIALRVGVRLNTIPTTMNNVPKCILMDKIITKYHECSNERLIEADLKVIFFHTNKTTLKDETCIEILGKQLVVFNYYLAASIHRARVLKIAITDKELKIYVLIDDAFEVFIREMDPSSDAMQEFRKNAFINFIRTEISIPDILLAMNEAIENLL
jgi:hypothetical protein